VLSTVYVSVEAIQSTSEAPGSPGGRFRFHSWACIGTNPPASVTVGFQLSGTASQGDGCGSSGDYEGEITSGTVTIPVAENHDNYVDLTFNAIDDLEVEDTETVIVTLDDDGGGVSVPPPGFTGRQATADIADNDVNVWVEASDAEGSELGGNPVSFEIFRHGGEGSDLTVYYTLGGTATPGIAHPELGGAILPRDADYFAGTPVNGDYFAVVIPSDETSVEVPFAPDNDSLMEFGESVELTIAPDQDFGEPHYNPPPTEGPASAEAWVKDLSARQPLDPNEPSAAVVASWVAKLDNLDFPVREQASAWLTDAFAAHPEIEPQLDQALSDSISPERTIRLKKILGPVRLTLEGNTIVASLRYDDGTLPPGTVTLVSTPGEDAFARFKRTGQNVIDITPTMTTDFELISFHIYYTDANGNSLDIPGRDRTFAFAIWEFM
jgi:hypothetical protein